MPAPAQSRPWYRVPIAWLALLLPLLAVFAGVNMLRLAGADSGDADPDVVVRRAGMQTKVSDEDLSAWRLGLAGVLTLVSDDKTIRLTASRLPPQPVLTLDWVHATRANLDRRSELRQVGPGQWQGDLPAGLHGAYGLRLNPPDRSWRLLGRLDGASKTIALAPAYAAPPRSAQ